MQVRAPAGALIPFLSKELRNWCQSLLCGLPPYVATMVHLDSRVPRDGCVGEFAPS